MEKTTHMPKTATITGKGRLLLWIALATGFFLLLTVAFSIGNIVLAKIMYREAPPTAQVA
jgi:hypothetical protein